MRRAAITILALGLAACATTMGGPQDVGLDAAALRVSPGTSAAAAAAALSGVDIALIAAPADAPWFAAVAEATGLHLSGPTSDGDLSLALLAMEPVGDTVIDLAYEGGSITMVDALYDLGDEHWLDLMAFRVEPGDPVQPMVTRLLRYIATDVPASAAVAFAIAVPSEAKGDSIARLLSPGFFDTLRCAGADNASPAARGGIRLFYGPEARLWCGDAEVAPVDVGTRVRADFTAGLR